MEKTSNFELNQWNKSDRIMMEDFNADNLKIDTVLGGIPMVELSKTTLAEPALQIDVDVSGMDLTQFSELIAYIHYPAGMEATSTRVRVNHLEDGYPGEDGDGSQSMMANVTLHSFTGVEKINIAVGRRLVISTCSPVATEEITSLNFCGYKSTNEKNFSAGTRIQLIGIRR